MGRTSLMLIIVFNATFMFMGYRLSNATSAAYEKYCAYADIEQAGLVLESAANYAISNALLAAPITADTILCTEANFLCTTDADVAKAKFSINKYIINTNGVRDGDSIYITGHYPLSGKIDYHTGKPYEITCTTSVRVRGNAFSQYVFYSESEKTSAPVQPIYWGNNEVCRGRMHTQDNLYTNGSAEFTGKVTTKGNVISSGAAPIFDQGHTKADISIPKKLDELNGLGKTGGALYNRVDTYVEFLSNGHVVVRTAAVGTESSSVWALPSTTTGNVTGSTGPPVPRYHEYNSVNDLTSNGVLLVQNGELHVKGVLDGKITLGAVDTTNSSGVNSGKSSVSIDGSLTYKDPPPSTKNPSNISNDMLGIVATNNILVSEFVNNDNTTKVVSGHTVHNGTPLSNVTINASIFSQTGGFGAENASGRASSGTLTVVGGLQQKQRQVVGTGGGTTGFIKDYDFDTNLLSSSPKGYPKTPFVVQSWVDNTNIPANFWE